jgi:hypothetical protein
MCEEESREKEGAERMNARKKKRGAKRGMELCVSEICTEAGRMFPMQLQLEYASWCIIDIYLLISSSKLFRSRFFLCFRFCFLTIRF